MEGAVLRERLRLRGRETEQQIHGRVRRATDVRIDGPYFTLGNSGAVTDSIARFIALLRLLKAVNSPESMPANQLEDAAIRRLSQE